MEEKEKHGKKSPSPPDKFNELFGFKLQELFSWNSFVRLMCRPCDPASLAVLRICFGLLMMIDIPQERGMANADSRWGNKDLCRFPLFNNLQVLPLEWMFVAYFTMFTGAAGIMLGLMFRTSCVLFMIPYWYIFFLDKTVWNNHSYLYGLFSIMLLVSDANRCWSIDGLLSPSIRNTHVPLWNYTLFRTQIFMVYFIAGLKKLDTDWMSGYSMQWLSKRWVFDPFRILLTDEQIDLFVVHFGGLTIDLFTGFLMFFDRTRPVAMFFTGMFHAMNSQLFSIGMFPYAMLATLPLFCIFSWPRSVLSYLSCSKTDDLVKPSSHCVYSKDQIKSDEKTKTSLSSTSPPPVQISFVHKTGTIFTIVYIAIQAFLPFSHGITKGYNNWTNGLYGYSWDMMVHSWSTQHIRLTYVDKNTREVGYLDPHAWVEPANRWSSHADMMVQYAHCIEDRLKKYEVENIELYFDVWKSMNNRFQQRMYDPRINLLGVEWSPFKEVSFSLPLLVDLSPWRSKLASMTEELTQASSYTDVTFVADFPGLYLENFVDADLGNTSITLLAGKIIVELTDQGGKNITLEEGGSMQIPSNQFHNVHTVSDVPSCYMYVYVNTTHAKFMEKIKELEEKINSSKINPSENKDIQQFLLDTGNPQLYAEAIEKRRKEKGKEELPVLQKFKDFISKKFHLFQRSAILTFGSLRSIVFHEPFSDFLNRTYTAEQEAMFLQS
ncbi:hypothetical protein FSP39_001567 [Pinctada imbricata]|uniref:Vitamin K-dependent gamma-carboxylase n=1 Tax=Pinctada imbricata TaxID=66713 RepID=A0AA88XPB6_PINIB|nr:hypothetical protein FSP39_001567 [Pinctada imbricata]